MAKPKTDSLAWFRLYPGIVTADLIGLSMAHAGAYLRLHNLYWVERLRLPEDEAMLYRKTDARTEEERAAVQDVLVEFFPRDPNGKRTNARLDEHYEEILATSAKQRERVAKRWDKAPQSSDQPPPPPAEYDDPRDF